MKKTKVIATALAGVTLCASLFGFSGKSYAKLSEDGEYMEPESAYEYSTQYIITLYAANSTGGRVEVKNTYNITEEMIETKEAIQALDLTGGEDREVDASLTTSLLVHLSQVHKGGEEVSKIKNVFTNALGCSPDDIKIINIIKSPAIPGTNISEGTTYNVTQDSTADQIRPIAVNLVQRELNIRQTLTNKYTRDEIEKIEKILNRLRSENAEGNGEIQNLYNEPWSALTRNTHTLIETDVEVKNVGTYSLVISKGEANITNRFYYILRKDIPDPEPAKFQTSLDYQAIEGAEVKKKKTSSEENPFLPYYTENDKNVKDMDAIAYIRSKTDENIVSVDGAKLVDGEENEKGWYYPNKGDHKVVAKKYPFDEYNNKTYNGKVSETVEVIGENDGKSTEKPNIEWTFRRKIKEEEKKDDGSKVITITFNLPIDESKIPDGWTPLKDDDGAVRRIRRTFKSNESYDNDVPVYQNGTGKEIKTPIKLTAPVISKTGESALIITGVVVAIAGMVYIRKRIK